MPALTDPPPVLGAVVGAAAAGAVVAVGAAAGAGPPPVAAGVAVGFAVPHAASNMLKLTSVASALNRTLVFIASFLLLRWTVGRSFTPKAGELVDGETALRLRGAPLWSGKRNSLP